MGFIHVYNINNKKFKNTLKNHDNYITSMQYDKK